jgi:hypothetical protein
MFFRYRREGPAGSFRLDADRARFERAASRAEALRRMDRLAEEVQALTKKLQGAGQSG